MKAARLELGFERAVRVAQRVFVGAVARPQA